MGLSVLGGFVILRTNEDWSVWLDEFGWNLSVVAEANMDVDPIKLRHKG